MLNGPDEFRRLKQRIVSPGIEPVDAASELLDIEFNALEVYAIDVRNHQLAARRRPQIGGNIHNANIIEVEAGDGPR